MYIPIWEMIMFFILAFIGACSVENFFKKVWKDFKKDQIKRGRV
jgi:hypothetical protein